MKTNNEGYGLYGTATTSGRDADKLWEECMNWLQIKYPHLEEIDARNYLDSTLGRHLADALTHMSFKEIETKWAGYMMKTTFEIKAIRDRF